MSTQQTSNPVLAVLGATGSQGGAVLRYLSSQANQTGTKYELRGITRNPDSEASRALKAQGVHMVHGDLSDPVSLVTAFKGASAIFATTDSNQLIFKAIQHPEILSDKQTPRSYARAIEEEMGRNIRDAAVQTESLERLIWSSLASPRKWSQGEFTHVDMFDAKESIADSLWACRELKEKLSVLLIGFYADNSLNVPDFYAPKKQPDGVYELALPMSGDTPVPMADLDADLGSWVYALLQASTGTTMVGQSQSLTWRAWLDLWGSRNSVPTRYRRESAEQFSTRMQGMAEAVAQEFEFVQKFGFTGGIPNVAYPQQLRDQGIEIQTTDIEHHISRKDWTKLLGDTS